MYDLEWRGVLHNIVNAFILPAKLIRLIKVYLQEIGDKLPVSKCLFRAYLDQNYHRGRLSHFIVFAYRLSIEVCREEYLRKQGGRGMKWDNMSGYGMCRQ